MEQNHDDVLNNNSFDIYFNGQSSLNVHCDDACNYTNGFSASDDDALHALNATSPFNSHVSYTSNDNNAIIEQQNPSVNSVSDIFRFVIPGFHIVVIPMSSPLVNLSNLDIQYQFQQFQQDQQDPTFFSSSVSPSQLNQEQSHVSSVNGTSDGINNQSVFIADNLDNLQQQQIDSLGLNYSFSNFNNLHS